MSKAERAPPTAERSSSGLLAAPTACRESSRALAGAQKLVPEPVAMPRVVLVPAVEGAVAAGRTGLSDWSRQPTRATPITIRTAMSPDRVPVTAPLYHAAFRAARAAPGTVAQVNRDTAPGDHTLATELAAEAGSLLLRLRRELGDADRDALGAEGDRRAHELLVRRLDELRPGDAVLSEEAVDDPGRLDAARVWIVDPLDGTREYAEGRDDWAVHVALVVNGELVAGAVSVPCLSRTYFDPTPAGGSSEGGTEGDPVAVSRTRAPAVAAAVARALGGELVPLGSAGFKAMAVVRGEVDAYVHAGGMFEWDSAAPVAVALAAGLHASRLDGSPLRYNQTGAWLPDLVICRAEVAGIVLKVASAASES